MSSKLTNKIKFKYADLQQELQSIKSFKPFINWQQEIQKLNLLCESVEIQDVDYFGKQIGFLKFKADLRYEDGQKLPGVVFCRGESVAIFLVIKTPTKEYVALVEQIRVPIAKSILELPAGMLDGDDSVTGVAIKELEEECGIIIKRENLTQLGRLCPSPGGCDEYVTIFSSELKMGDDEARQLHNKLGGLRDHGERISVNLVKFEELYNCESMAVLAALALYQKQQSIQISDIKYAKK